MTALFNTIGKYKLALYFLSIRTVGDFVSPGDIGQRHQIVNSPKFSGG
ncbi:hypothetical protein SAMN02745215_03347 [Desulfitobacterium chlororespirans DSM 11544]|uniref:Uncharacterized protein n=1 Tax=Desulfitobacterium chlororespirans DSM 11544 TaxID=1121395 RepID=A0A1M7UAT8_9FIRM|nr:hypothetical protein SAMN02745215_03347 [Desulfitobacterium chlororespirans DSM 11544]